MVVNLNLTMETSYFQLQDAPASYGENPPNFSIPDFIRTFAQGEMSPQGLAEAIYNRILKLEHRGNFGLIIMGNGASNLEIWEVLSQIGFNQVNLSSGELCTRGQPVPIQELTAFENLDIARSEMLSIFRQVASDNTYVGPLYEFAEIREVQVLEITREI